MSIKLNGTPVIPTMFPDGTSQVWGVFAAHPSLNNQPVLEVEWKFESEAELIHLAQLKMLLDNITPEAHKILSIPYLPYARQDKQVSDSNTFALSTFARMLNAQAWDMITVIDPHSNIDKLINNVFAISPASAIEVAVKASEAQVICFPDHGASQRDYPRFQLPTFSLSKKRNQQTGAIIGLGFDHYNQDYCPVDITGKSVIIVDDLCDRGGTFMAACKLLKEHGAAKISLYTTHGLYTGGTRIIFDAGIDRIFNKNGEVPCLLPS